MPSAADVVVLSSTPDHNSTRTPQQTSYGYDNLSGTSSRFASPPPLPSPSQLFRQLQSPSNGTPQDTEKDVRRKTTGNQAADKSTYGKATENKPKRGRREITDELQTVLTHVEPAALGFKDNVSKKAPPKTRTKRTGTENKRGGSRNKTLTGRVSKAGSADSQEPDAKKPSSSQSSSQRDPNQDLDNWEASGLQLEEATRRRLDWTPTKVTGKQVFDLESDGDAGGSQTSGPSQKFSSLLAGYGFSGTVSSQPSFQGVEDGGGPTKRRRINLTDSRLQAGPKSTTKDKDSVQKERQQKPKKQNKKFTTLTARVTARYAPGHTEDSDNGSLYTGDAQDRTDNENAGRKRKSKTKANPQEPEFIVLSPEAALKSLEGQDLMFGTCSQLEREDSPTTLRDMQTAIKESECYMDSEPKPGAGRTPSGSTMSRFTHPRNLWSEAFRDLDGALAQAEVLDLVDDCDISKISPRVDNRQRERSDAKQQEAQKLVEKNTPEKEVSEPERNPSASGTLSQPADDGNQQKETASTTVESRPQMPQYNGFTDAELSKQIASFGFKAVRGRRKMIELLQKCWESRHGTDTTSNENESSTSLDGSASTKPPETGKDGKNGDTSNKTSASSSRPKAKSAANPPTADDASTRSPARRRQGSSRPPSSSSQKAAESRASQPPQPPQQQKPPSQQKSSYADVEEIQDSEDEAIPSPNQLLSRYFTHTKPSNQSLAASPTPSPSRRAASRPQSRMTTPISRIPEEEEEEPDLATQITKAVHAQPNMSSSVGGRKSPSWHEKILMYDPIVLEDFTTWLNTEGLGLVSEDREVGAGLVREWCEIKGICCCYRHKSW